MYGKNRVARIPLQRTAENAYRNYVPTDPKSRGEEFGRLIRDGRLTLGISQEELARRAGIDRGTIIRWEAGGATRPDPDQVRGVCKELGVDPQRAAIALGYLSPDDVAKPDRGTRQLDPRILEVIDTLEDPRVPAEEKQAWVDYLRYLRQKSAPGSGHRNAS